MDTSPLQTQASAEARKTKRLYLELMRIVAAFFVIFNHTGPDGFFLFSTRPFGSLLFWIDLFLSVFCKFAVPLFFAISGALMLDREDEPLGVIWKKRILKMAIVLVLFSVAYYLFGVFGERGQIDLKTFLKCLYSAHWFHLSFLYSYIAYLMCLPFLRALARNLKTEYFYYLFALVFVLQACLSSAEYLLTQNEWRMNSLFRCGWLSTTIVLYPCLGYFLEHRVDIGKVKKPLWFLWLLNVATILLACYMTYDKAIATSICNEYDSQAFHNTFAIVNCATMFLTIKYAASRLRFPPLAQKAILSLGSCSFGVYLLHLFVLKTRWCQAFLALMTQSGLSPMLAALVECLCAMLLCWLATWALKKIPVVRRLF